MIKIIGVLSVSYVAWLFLSDSGSMFLSPVQPSAKAPTFEGNMARLSILRQASEDGLLQEDSARQGQRQAVLDAYEDLKSDHCDPQVKQEFVNAIKPFVHHLRSRTKPAIETYEVDGKVLSTTGFLDSEAKGKISEAIYSGYLAPTELPGAAGAAFARARRTQKSVAAFRSFATAEPCTG